MGHPSYRRWWEAESPANLASLLHMVPSLFVPNCLKAIGFIQVLYSGPVLDTKCQNALFVSKDSNKYWGDDFHVYSVKWTPESLILSVDGEEYGRIEAGSEGLRASLPKTCAGPPQAGMAPFDDHFYITLGLAVGGHAEFPDACISKDHKKPWKNHASKATVNFWNDIDAWHDTWELPKLLVDYVKVVAL
ncbi:beta-1,3-glucan-binding protein-like [Leguminivora glycinivorella]|uniref:beta-1,3-glucan-binding protein-like n=1 Tax=Leguminivora glycinivorella TaxID=1035111 RepID=UPI00200EE7E8|nr:beta-1,3-glucan-binding protein-like [Leguminivora glycinivorella]